MDYFKILKEFIELLDDTELVYVDDEVFEILVQIYKKGFKDGYEEALEEANDIVADKDFYI